MEDSFFTGKPRVGEMGYAFLFRACRADPGRCRPAILSCNAPFFKDGITMLL